MREIITPFRSSLNIYIISAVLLLLINHRISLTLAEFRPEKNVSSWLVNGGYSASSAIIGKLENKTDKKYEAPWK